MKKENPIIFPATAMSGIGSGIVSFLILTPKFIEMARVTNNDGLPGVFSGFFLSLASVPFYILASVIFSAAIAVGVGFLANKILVRLFN